jgi:hypothetical protein
LLLDIRIEKISAIASGAPELSEVRQEGRSAQVGIAQNYPDKQIPNFRALLIDPDVQHIVGASVDEENSAASEGQSLAPKQHQS